MAWSLQAGDLTEENIILGENLSSFLNTVLSGKATEARTERELSLSIRQDKFAQFQMEP